MEEGILVVMIIMRNYDEDKEYGDDERYADDNMVRMTI